MHILARIDILIVDFSKVIGSVSINLYDLELVSMHDNIQIVVLPCKDIALINTRVLVVRREEFSQIVLCISTIIFPVFEVKEVLSLPSRKLRCSLFQDSFFLCINVIFRFFSSIFPQVLQL